MVSSQAFSATESHIDLSLSAGRHRDLNAVSFAQKNSLPSDKKLLNRVKFLRLSGRVIRLTTK